MIIKIETTSNGVIITDGDKVKSVHMTDDDFQDFNADAVVTLMYTLLDAMGYINQKYNKHNVEIRVVHGRGYECKDKKCEICKESNS